MFLIVAFMIVHVVLVAIFPRTLVSMSVGTGRTEMPKMNGRVPVIKFRDIQSELRQLQRRAFLLGGLVSRRDAECLLASTLARYHGLVDTIVQ